MNFDYHIESSKQDKKMMYRKITKPKGQVRKKHQISLTDSEHESLNQLAHSLGFKRVQDLFIAVASQPSYKEGIEAVCNESLYITLIPLRTIVNLIKSGIDVESNTQLLISEVQRLCQDFRF